MAARLVERSVDEPDPGDVTSMFIWLRDRQRSSRGPWRGAYAWSMLAAARTARALGLEQISVLEFGVAGGNGLIAMEAMAEAVEAVLDVRIGIYGFDTGEGMPVPSDPRDAPFALREGDFAMDLDKLRARLQRTELLLGDVGDTAREFIANEHPPIGFIAFDLDYYTSTMAAFKLLEGGSERLLPRVFCYFDDLHYPPWTAATGEAAAIDEFNRTHEQRTIANLPGLKHALPRSEQKARWPDLMFITEVFDHGRYADREDFQHPDLRLRS